MTTIGDILAGRTGLHAEAAGQKPPVLSVRLPQDRIVKLAAANVDLLSVVQSLLDMARSYPNSGHSQHALRQADRLVKISDSIDDVVKAVVRPIPFGQDV